MSRALYTLALWAAVPYVLLRLWWRARREPGYRRLIGERFGYYADSPPRGIAGAASPRMLLWVHAVSVGEARASAPLVRALGAANPLAQLLVTCTTAAGRDTLSALHGDSVIVAWLPYDYPGAVRRFLAHFRPDLGVLMETEIWPNLLDACAGRGVPVLLANARMSEKSAAGYRRWRALARPALASLACVCAQSEADAARLRSLGARRVEVTGSVKFDSAPDEAKRRDGKAWRARLARPVLLLASTRDGEEELLLDALPASIGNALVLLVPRHPQRFDEVAGIVARHGRPAPRRSGGAMPGTDEHFYLGDTMGEMDFYYAAADVALIGGSFRPHGGQNLIEACAAGVPVVLGPSMFNFAEVTRLAVEAGAAFQAADAASALREAFGLLADRRRSAAMGEAGMRLCAAHRGATRRHLQMCKEILQAPAAAAARAATRD